MGQNRVFMQGMRALITLIAETQNVNIVGPYGISNIVYYKETASQARLYHRTPRGGFTSTKVSLYDIERDDAGSPIQSRRKNVTAFVANYVHFLDATVCHFVVDKFTAAGNKIGTIHDSFFIPGQDFGRLNKLYRTGLALTCIVHQYNMLRWLKLLIDAQILAKLPNKNNSQLVSDLTDALTRAENWDNRNALELTPTVWENLLDSLQTLGKHSRTKEMHYARLMDYLKAWKKNEKAETFLNRVECNDTPCLFIDK